MSRDLHMAALADLEKENERLREQNKRYRVYLEIIRTEGLYEFSGEIKRSNESDLADEALEGSK